MTRWHLPLVLLVSIAFESLFLRHGLATLDEAWPLLAARELLEGGTLYRDVFFVFPPGHLLAALLGQAFDPPGLLLARAVYAAFDVAACAGLYLLGRRVMSPGFALLGALLLAIGAPASHLAQMLFGYRYLALGMLALLCLARRIETGDTRWCLAAGIAIGLTLTFRLTPAFASGLAVAVGIVALDPRPRAWLRDGGWFALGVLGVALPVLAVLAWHAGPGALWTEIVVRPLVMTERQGLSLPALALPGSFGRIAIRDAFVAVRYRGEALLYGAYVLVLLWRLVAARRAGRPFDEVFLLALAVWGASYFGRTLGRADELHLDTALPPACLLAAHAASRLRSLTGPLPDRLAAARDLALGAGMLGLFAFVSATDHLLTAEHRGRYTMQTTGDRILPANRFVGREVDAAVGEIRRRSAPGDVVLDLSASPMLLVLSGRDGPGGPDLLMPGTFLDAEEEIAFVGRLARRPPALVVWSRVPFDLREDRDVRVTAPRVAAWVEARYAPVARHGRFAIWSRSASP